jgi:hypothetical protein
MASKGALVAFGGAGAGTHSTVSIRDLSDIAAEFDMLREKTKEVYADVHARTNVGGVRLAAVISEKYAKASQFKSTFAVHLLSVHAALEKDQAEMFIVADEMTGEEFIRLPVNTSKGPKAKKPPPNFWPPPTEKDLRAYEACTLGIENELSAQLDAVQIGDIVYLNGVHARAAVVGERIDAAGNPDYSKCEWNIFLNVGRIDPTGFSMVHLWHAMRHLPTSALEPNDQPYVESDVSSRYNRKRSCVFKVLPEPDDDDEEAIDASNRLMAAECGRTTLDVECLTANQDGFSPFRAQKTLDRPEGPRANLTFTHGQWPRNTPYERGMMELVAVGITAYESLLRVFGVHDLLSWETLARSIFMHCPMVWMGFVDTRGTIASFGGINMSAFKFALQIFPTCVIPDIATLCRRIGIPVTAKFVTDWQATRLGACGSPSPQTLRASPSDIISKLPPTVPVSGGYADPMVAALLVKMATSAPAGGSGGHGARANTPKFYAWLNINLSRANMDALATLTPENGEKLANALLRPKGGLSHVTSTPGLTAIYKNMAIQGGAPVCVIHALCEDIAPPDVRENNNNIIMKLITGKQCEAAAPPPPALALALEAPPTASPQKKKKKKKTTTTSPSAAAAAAAAATIEEVSDDDEEEEEDTPPPLAPKDAPRRRADPTDDELLGADAAAEELFGDTTEDAEPTRHKHARKDREKSKSKSKDKDKDKVKKPSKKKARVEDEDDDDDTTAADE